MVWWGSKQSCKHNTKVSGEKEERAEQNRETAVTSKFVCSLGRAGKKEKDWDRWCTAG